MNRRKAILAKIRARCEIVAPPEPLRVEEFGPCWLWQGPDSGKPGRGRAKGRGHSYPRMNLDGCTVAVHRTAWQCEFGPLPRKRQLDHLCRRRMCVAPMHGENVTHKENQRRKPPKCETTISI